MVIIQDSEKNILSVGTTLPKAMDKIGIPRVKYEYMGKLLSTHPRETIIKYKSYFLSKW